MLTRPRTIFITGTDTGVGKTLLTSLLLCHLRRTGHPTLALKPFCSGSRADARRLRFLQAQPIENSTSVVTHLPSLEEVNPFFYPAPLAPLIAARQLRRPVKLQSVLDHIHAVTARALRGHHQGGKARPLFLLLEGSGGLLVPLGENHSVLDLIVALHCEVIVVARNRLGTLNHSLLTIRALQQAGVQRLRLALMNCKKPDLSARTNAALLAELLAPVPHISIPFLPAPARARRRLFATAARLRRTLSRLV